MRAVGDIRGMIAVYGFSDANVTIEPYHDPDSSAPIRLSYLRFVAQGPDCGLWTSNLAEDPRNLAYPNFGCAQQHNLAAQVANPADLLGPRTVEPMRPEVGSPSKQLSLSAWPWQRRAGDVRGDVEAIVGLPLRPTQAAGRAAREPLSIAWKRFEAPLEVAAQLRERGCAAARQGID